jgi:hypothetical protein
MDADTTKVITELTMSLQGVKEDIKDIKENMKELKKCIPSIDAHNELERTIARINIDLDKRLSKVESNLSKVVWMVLSAVIGAILYLVIGVK